MDSAALAAYEMIALVAIGATLAGLLAGYVWGCHASSGKEPVSAHTPAGDPLVYVHLPVAAEKEQAL